MLAYRKRDSNAGNSKPGIVFVHGFRSDMGGQKATFLDKFCAERDLAYVRYDAFGHGASDGNFEDGTIGRWASDLIAVLDHLTTGPQILVGSSMGGWLMLLAARVRRPRIAALVGLAAAPDFTQELMLPAFMPAERAAMDRDGYIDIPSRYGDAYRITRKLIDEGANNLVLGSPIDFDGPVRLLQGMADPDVPWEHGLRLTQNFAGNDVRLTLIKDGDHRLSRDQDFFVLGRTLEELL